MKRRILSLLLALCLVVGLLPMMVLAEEGETPAATATLTINTAGPHTASAKRVNWTPTLSAGMAPVYAKTTDEGVVTTTGASADDWNLKVEWAADGVPTLTMHNAYLVNNNVNTSTYAGTVYNTINIGGTADFVIALEGTNATKDGWLAGTGQAIHRVPQTIVATNSGTLTIRGNSKADSLTIDNSSDSCIEKFYNALTIEDASVTLYMSKTNQANQVGIAMLYGTEGCEDLTDLTVRNSNLTIKTLKSWTSYTAILMSDTAAANYTDASVDKNTGDILFQNSNINFNVSLSTGQTNRDGYEMVNFGADSTCTIDNCEGKFYARHLPFSYVPTINNATATLATEAAPSEIMDFPNEDLPVGTLLFGQQYSYVNVTHASCVESDPADDVVMGAGCTKTTYTVTQCVVCDKEMSRAVKESTTVHTIGAKVELEELREDAYIDTSTISVHPGKYVFQCTCSVCGETWTEEETFKPAVLYYLSLNEEGETTRQENFNTVWADQSASSYKPKLTITAGETYYFTTEGGHATFTENKYVTRLTDEEKIAAGEWNIKFEYPLYGDPIMTLKDAEVLNGCGLWYGAYAYRDLAPLTVVVEGTNKFAHPGNSSWVISGLLSFRTNNPVTIIGKGNDAFLDLDSRAAAAAIVRSIGDLTFQNVGMDIYIHVDSSHGKGTGSVIQSTSGNITIEDCDIDINATAPKGKTGVTYGIKASKTLTVTDSDIFALANVNGDKYGILHATDVIINESALQLAICYRHKEGATGNRYGDAIYYSNSVKFNYSNGMTAHSSSTRTTYYPDNAEGEQWTAPSLTTYTSIAKLTASVLNGYYFDITPKTTLVDFAGSAVTVEDDLTLEFAMDANLVEAGSIAHVTRGKNTTKITLDENCLEEGYYVIPCTGIAAKEMHDEVTVVIKSADGATVLSETKTDSVYNYLLRMLATEQGDMSDAKYAALRTVVADMLNYGAMAQVRFMHNTENLANTTLTPTQWTYATNKMAETPATPATVEGADASVHLGTTFELNNNIAMLIAVEGKATSAKVYVDGEYKEDITAVAYNGFVTFAFNGMVAADGRKDIRFEVYTGEELTLTVTDSLAAYVGRNVARYTYLADLMKYCDSAAAYFAIVKAEAE